MSEHPLPPSRRASHIQPSLIRRLYDARRPTSINLGLGEPGSAVPLELFDRGVARYRAVRTGYTANAGLLELRDAIRAHFALPHVTGSDQVIVTSGVQEALFSTLVAIADPGDEIIIGDPTFLAYRTVAELVGLTVKCVPLSVDRGFAIDPARLADAVTPRTKAIILCSPANPTGRIDSLDSMRALIELTERSGVWLIGDEVYGECWFGPSPPPSIGKLSERSIVLGALSKSCSLTGFRLGWVLAPKTVAKAIGLVHQFNVTCAPAISQHIALEVFDKPGWLGFLRGELSSQRAAMLERIAEDVQLPYAPPEGGFFLFLDIRPTGFASLALAERLLEEADVVTVPGVAFGQNGEGFLRLSYAGPAEAIREGVRRIGGFFRAQ